MEGILQLIFPCSPRLRVLALLRDLRSLLLSNSGVSERALC